MHDGGHFALSRYPAVNGLLAHLGGAHMSMFSWYHQHTIGHHVDTSIPGFDPDLYHFTMLAQHPGFRTSLELCPFPEQVGIYPRKDWWWNGMKMRVPLSTFGPSIIWDMNSLIAPEFAQAFLGLVPYRPFWMKSLFMHSAGRSVVIWLAIIHPIAVCLVTADSWLTGALWAILFVVVPYAIHGCIFYVFSQVSHVQQECSSTQLAEQGIHADEAMKPQEWAAHQVEHAIDYAVGSTFWLHVSVGLNLQVIHHLFPQVGWGHYTELSPIVRDVCAEFNVKYTVKPSFWDAVASHYRHLVDINYGPNADVWFRPPVGKANFGTLDLLGQFGMRPERKAL